jgi:hypothetical protein
MIGATCVELLADRLTLIMAGDREPVPVRRPNMSS